MKQKILVVFSHGKESGPWGSKFKVLAKIANNHGAQVMSVDYRKQANGEDVDQNAAGEADRRVAYLLATTLPDHDRLILVGSSMGGYVSTVASATLKPDGLFLLAPAFYIANYAQQNPVASCQTAQIIHGWSDEVIPYQNSIKFAAKHLCSLQLLNGDHRLNDAIDQIGELFKLFLNRMS